MGYPNFYNNEIIESIIKKRDIEEPGYSEYRKRLSGYYTKDNQHFTRLIHAYVETASSCNYMCPSCTHGNSEESSQYTRAGIMTMDLFKKSIDQLQEIGCDSISVYNCNEPLLDKLIFERLEYLRGKFFDIVFMTNGSLLNEEFIKNISDSPITRICFSVDAASNSTYAQTRPSRKESMAISYDNLKSIIHKLINHLNILRPDIITRASFVVSNVNAHEANQFIQDWSPIVHIVELQDYHAMPYNADLVKTSPDFHQLKIESCAAPFTTLQIRPDGKVYPCCTMYATYDKFEHSNLCVGDLRLQSLEEIWLGSEFEIIRNNLKAGKPCINCMECMSNHFVYTNLHEADIHHGFQV